MTHLRQIMLEELRRRNFAESTIHTYIHTVEHFSRYFHRSPDQLGPEHIRQYQATLFTRWKLAPNTVIPALGRFTLLLYSGVEARLERCRDAVSEEGAALAAGAEPGRSGASDRRGRVSLSSHPADDALCHRSTPRRSGALEGQRYRQPADGHSYPGRQGTQGPRCHAQPEAARCAARLLARAGRKPTDWLFPGNRWHTASHPVSTKVLWHACQQAAERAGLDTSTSIPTPCATALPRICSKPVPTCAPSRCCWGIATWKRPRSICISPGGISAPPPVRWMHSRSAEKESRRRAHEPASSGGGRHRSLCRTVLH